MAKCIITIEDSPLKDKVKFTMNPTFSQLAIKVKNSNDPLTSAEAYAIACANLVMRESKKSKEPTRIIIPRLRG